MNWQPDTISLTRLAKLHPKLCKEATDTIIKLWQQGIRVRVTSTLRTYEEQAALYAIGRTTPGRIVTMAKPGQSFHNYGLAFDFCILDSKGKPAWDRSQDFNGDYKPDWIQVANTFKEQGWEWGGDWNRLKDYPHLQKTFGIKTTELMARSSNGIIRYPNIGATA